MAINYNPPWSVEAVKTAFPETIPDNLHRYLVMGEERITYSTGAQYQRTDWVYAKYGMIDRKKDEVSFMGLIILRDYPNSNITGGPNNDGFYYELIDRNIGNSIAGLIETEEIVESISSSYQAYHKDLDMNKFIDNSYHGLTASGQWKCIPIHYLDIKDRNDISNYVEIRMYSDPETYSYKYVSRGTIISSGNLVLGEEPSAPANPATYDEGNYRYTFSRWELSVSNKDRTYTAVFASQTLYRWNKYSTATEYVWNQHGIIKDGVIAEGGSTRFYGGKNINGNGGNSVRILNGSIAWNGATGYFSGQCEVLLSYRYVQITGGAYGAAGWFAVNGGNLYNGVVCTALSIVWTDKIGTYITGVTSQNRSAYPDNAISGSYWYVYSTSRTVRGNTNYGQVISTNSGAYPANGVSGSYWYVRS